MRPGRPRRLRNATTARASTWRIQRQEHHGDATYVDDFIMFCAGLGMTSVGFGYLSLSRNPAHKMLVVRHFRWIGPLAARHRHYPGSRLMTSSSEAMCAANLDHE